MPLFLLHPHHLHHLHLCVTLFFHCLFHLDMHLYLRFALFFHIHLRFAIYTFFTYYSERANLQISLISFLWLQLHFDKVTFKIEMGNKKSYNVLFVLSEHTFTLNGIVSWLRWSGWWRWWGGGLVINVHLYHYSCKMFAAFLFCETKMVYREKLSHKINAIAFLIKWIIIFIINII